jgi:repressor of nif and glnA expression
VTDDHLEGLTRRTVLSAEEFCWSSLVASVVHPVKVAIIEALLWIEEPLSAAQIVRLFRGAGREFYDSNIRFHLSALVEMGLLEAACLQEAASSSKGKRFYFRAPTGEDSIA